MPPAPLPLLSCSCPCSPPPPQGRWPVCAERGTCAPSLPHFPTSPRSFFFPFSFAPPPIRDSVLPRSPPCNTPLHSSAHSSPPFFLLLLSFIPPPIRVPVFPRSPPCDTPLIRSSISTSPLLCSFVPPRPLFFFFHLSFVPPPIRVPFSRVPRRATFPSAPLRQVLTGNREKSRQPHRRSSRTKKSDPLGPDTIGYQSVFQKKGDYISRIRMLSPNIIKAVRTH